MEEFTIGDIGGLGDLGEVDFSIDNFSGVSINADLENSRYITPKVAVVPKRHVLYENAKKLAHDIDLTSTPRYDVIVGGNFIFGDFVEAFLVRNNCQARRMVINTLSLSQENVDSLHNLLLGDYIIDLEICTSTFFYNKERHTLVPYIFEKLDIDDRFQLSICDTHMKTVTILTDGGKYIVIHGSANFKSNGAIEQFTIEMNKDLYEFYNSITDKIREAYSVIQKGIQKQALYKIITTTTKTDN